MYGEPRDSLQVLSRVESELRDGRPTRSRAALLQAIRLTRGGHHAADAYALLARLDLRHGRNARALTAARAAVRQAKRAGASPAGGLLLARHALLQAGEAHLAQATARHALRAAEAVAQQVTARRQQIRAAWEVGEPAHALLLAAEVRKADPLAHAEVLCRAGCPTTAERELSRALARAANAEVEARLLLERGHTRTVLGQTDRAARDFRAAMRLAVRCQDVRFGIRATLGLAAVEKIRALGQGNPAQSGRAAVLCRKAARAVRQLRDPLLALLWERTAVWPPTASLPKAPRDAARTLLDLACRCDSLAFAEACEAEFYRLGALPPGTPAYAFEPLPLGLLG